MLPIPLCYNDLVPPEEREPEGWHGIATVLGKAVTQGSKRLARNIHTGIPMLVEDRHKELRSWQGDLRVSLRETAPPEPLRGPLRVEVRIFLRRPQGHFGAKGLKPTAPRFPTVKPDGEKVARAVGDVLTGLWVVDDAYVASWIIHKRYDDGNGERVEVEAWELDPVGEAAPARRRETPTR